MIDLDFGAPQILHQKRYLTLLTPVCVLHIIPEMSHTTAVACSHGDRKEAEMGKPSSQASPLHTHSVSLETCASSGILEGSPGHPEWGAWTRWIHSPSWEGVKWPLTSGSLCLQISLPA